MESLEKKLIKFVTAHEDILIAYLFGSQHTGKTHSESDVDVALLFRADKSPSAEQFLEIQDDLTRLLLKEVDIVVLNHASPIIRMQVLQKGKKLFEREHRAFTEFFVRTLNEYSDLKQVRAVIEQKIERGRIYG